MHAHIFVFYVYCGCRSDFVLCRYIINHLSYMHACELSVKPQTHVNITIYGRELCSALETEWNESNKQG